MVIATYLLRHSYLHILSTCMPGYSHIPHWLPSLEEEKKEEDEDKDEDEDERWKRRELK